MAKFVRGRSGNPNGRPNGSRNRSTVEFLEVLRGRGKEIARKLIDLGLAGDVQALKAASDRLCPIRREGGVTIDLPTISGPRDCVDAMVMITRAIAAGELAPGEGNDLSRIYSTYLRAFEVASIDDRLTAVEKASAERGLRDAAE